MTKFVAFYRNVGMLFRRQTYTIMGNLCMTCVHKQFWKFEALDVVLGPWGMLSAIVAPIYFVQNIFSYVAALYKLSGAENPDSPPSASKSPLPTIVILIGVVALLLLGIRAITKKQHTKEQAASVISDAVIGGDTEQVLCGKTLKSARLFAGPDFQTASALSLACGENVRALADQGDWTKLQTQKGVQGFLPKWFVGLPNTTPELTDKCDRPSPMKNPQQFEKLKTALDGFVDAENFSPEFQEPAHKETEDLGASAYFLAYLTAENPGKTKAEVLMGAVNDPRVFGDDYAKLSADGQQAMQTWYSKTIDVMSKAFDLGYEEGGKLPCKSK
jgi:hypothetical protein